MSVDANTELQPIEIRPGELVFSVRKPNDVNSRPVGLINGLPDVVPPAASDDGFDEYRAEARAMGLVVNAPDLRRDKIKAILKGYVTHGYDVFDLLKLTAEAPRAVYMRIIEIRPGCVHQLLEPASSSRTTKFAVCLAGRGTLITDLLLSSYFTPTEIVAIPSQTYYAIRNIAEVDKLKVLLIELAPEGVMLHR